MTLRSFLRPRRSLAFPFAGTLYSILWFVLRDANRLVDGEVKTVISTETVAVAGGAIVVSYVVAAAVATVVDATETSAWKRWLFAPSNATLGLFAVASLGFGVQLLDWASFPGWLDGVGVLLGWPLVALYVVAVVGGEVLLGQQVIAVEFAAVAVGVALSVAWQFVLFDWLTDAVRGVVGAASPTSE